MLFENAGKEVKVFSAGLYVTLRTFIVIFGIVCGIYYAVVNCYTGFTNPEVGTFAGIVAALYAVIIAFILTRVATLLAYLFCLVCAAFGELVEGVNAAGKNTQAIAEALRK